MLGGQYFEPPWPGLYYDGNVLTQADMENRAKNSITLPISQKIANSDPSDVVSYPNLSPVAGTVVRRPRTTVPATELW